MGSSGGGKPAGSIQSVGKEKVSIVDQDGYELVKRPRWLAKKLEDDGEAPTAGVGYAHMRSEREKEEEEEAGAPIVVAGKRQ